MSEYKRYFLESFHEQHTDKSLEVSNLESKLLSSYPELQDLHLYIAADKTLFISSIRVKKEFRGNGIGSKVMNEIIRFADLNKLIVTLSPQPEPRYKEKLNKFYKQYGFIPNKGRYAKTYLGGAFGLYMYRMPR